MGPAAPSRQLRRAAPTGCSLGHGMIEAGIEDHCLIPNVGSGLVVPGLGVEVGPDGLGQADLAMSPLSRRYLRIGF